MFEKIIDRTLKRSEILSGKKNIQELFDKGSSFYLHPFKIITHPNASSEVHQVLFSVSKRNFKKAVDRNLIKRRMREAYRLHKHMLVSEPIVLSIAYIYTSKEIVDYQTIANQLKQSLSRIITYVEKKSK